MKKPISLTKVVVGYVTLAIVVIGLSPLIDQAMSVLPYNFQTKQFYGEIVWWCTLIYYSVPLITTTLIIVPLVLLYCLARYPKMPQNKRNLIRRFILVVYLSLILGPGLIVNSFLKDNWGRARPYQVIRDGAEFSLPYQPNFDRPMNNSFPSGHAAIGAFIGVPFFVLGRRRLGIALSITGLIVVGLVRILQGGHYFSDVLIAGIIVGLVTSGIIRITDKYFIMDKRK